MNGLKGSGEGYEMGVRGQHGACGLRATLSGSRRGLCWPQAGSWVETAAFGIRQPKASQRQLRGLPQPAQPSPPPLPPYVT